MPLTGLPSLNAALNATSAVLLVSAFLAIRARRITLHVVCMLTACVVSVAFLASYLYYHAHVGSIRFTGAGWSRPVYFLILISHTVLAIVIVPLVARTLLLAARRQFDAHRAIARWTLPLWLYVSITGVIVYWMLYRMPAAEACPGCKEALFDPGKLTEKLATSKAYALSIGMLLTVPFLLVGGVAFAIARASRKRRRASDTV